MPKGPQGQKRPADAIGATVMVATGEIEGNQKSGRVRSGKAGAKARSVALSKEERSKITKKSANTR